MTTLTPADTVGEFVRRSPKLARVFENFGIDYCCGGKRPLVQACQKRGIDIAEVMRQLDVCESSDEAQNLIDVDSLSLTELADHIEATHHAYLRDELPRLEFMTEKVSRVHGDKSENLHRMRDAFVALKADLEPHMMKEERVLFPIVRQLEASADRPQLHCGTVANPIRQMEHEHDIAGEALAILRESTDGYTPPDSACNTYRAMLESLARLEADIHQHIHKENNVLFVKVQSIE